jgi:hypothetical protein
MKQTTKKYLHWRDRCSEACARINFVLGLAQEERINVGQTYAIHKMMYAIFDEHRQVNLSERRDLIHWLGRASAMEVLIPDPISENVRMIDIVAGLLINKWAAEAWHSPPDLDRPQWAQSLIHRICISSNDVSLTEGRIPDNPEGWLRRDKRKTSRESFHEHELDFFTAEQNPSPHIA